MSAAGSLIRILHVDDEPGFAEMVGTFLQREDEDLRVEPASTASEALDELDSRDFDCVVSDYDMHEQTGLELLTAIREDHPDVPFILFTGKGSEEVASEAISAGVTDYLQKETGTDQYTILANRIRNAVEQTQADRERKRSDRRFEAIFDDPDQLVGILAPDGTLRQVNEAATDVFGEALADAVGDRVWELPWWDNADHPKAKAWIERASDGEYVDFETSHEGSDGQTKHLEGTVRPVRDDEGTVTSLVVSAREVTERRKLKAELQEKATLLDQIFEQVPIHLYIKDTEGRHTHYAEWYLHDKPFASEETSKVGKTDLELYDGAFAREAHADDMHVIETGEPVIDKVEYNQRHDEWNLTSKAPLYDGDGEIQGLIGVSRKFTERKETRERLERQNERLEKVIRVVSHDLRNPLNVANGQLALAREECESDRLERVARAQERMETLIGDLLTLAREGEEAKERRPVRLESVVTDCWETVETGEASLTVDGDATFEADVGRLRQLLANLVGNAVDHGGPDPTVRVGTLPDEQGFFVADDGPGIPESARGQVFDLGYSTTDDGTGFGLGIVEEIVEAHDWSIRVAESTDGGARFEVTGVDVESAS